MNYYLVKCLVEKKNVALSFRAYSYVGTWELELIAESEEKALKSAEETMYDMGVEKANFEIIYSQMLDRGIIKAKRLR